MNDVPYVTFLTFDKPPLDSVFEACERSRIEQNQYNKFTSRNCRENSFEKQSFSSMEDNDNILNRRSDIIQLIVGVSIQKRGIGKISGAHAFLMYNAEPYDYVRKWQDDVMLDASGSYGDSTFRKGMHTDVVTHVFGRTSPATISIDAYRRYFFYGELNELGEMIKPGFIDELLYTYTFIIDKTLGENMKTLILNKSRRDPVSCAKDATGVLKQSGLFPNVKVSMMPSKLKKNLDTYVTHNNRIIDLKEKHIYDLDVYP
jgi:hypothetical protein